MAGLVVDTGLVQEMGLIDADTANWDVHLYKNNYTPAGNSVPGSFTECDYDGYSPQTPGAFSQSSTGTGNARITSAAMTFLKTGNVTNNLVYGYYVTDGAGDVVLAELLPGGPYNFNAIGIGIVLTVVQDMNSP